MAVIPTGIPGVTADGSGNMNISSRSTPLVGLAPTAVLVGVITAPVVAANANRKSLVLINTSGGVISFGLDGNTAVLNTGITLTSGGIWTMDKDTFSTGAIAAIGDGADLNLAIQEFE